MKGSKSSSSYRKMETSKSSRSMANSNSVRPNNSNNSDEINISNVKVSPNKNSIVGRIRVRNSAVPLSSNSGVSSTSGSSVLSNTSMKSSSSSSSSKKMDKKGNRSSMIGSTPLISPNNVSYNIVRNNGSSNRNIVRGGGPQDYTRRNSSGRAQLGSTPLIMPQQEIPRSVSRGRSMTSPVHGTNAAHTNSQPYESSPRSRSKSSPPKVRSMSPSARLRRSISPSAKILRKISRSRSASWGRRSSSSDRRNEEQLLVAVTSCRSDAYHYQKAPGATSRLPRKAPSNLKNFHELAVGVKDAYNAVGALPVKPEHRGGENEEQWILWEFMGNLDFLLALVDEVAVDTVTRGALKDDTTFKGLRDVIKKSNKILESMLVRREKKYTLFIRLVQPGMPKEIASIKKWNAKVEKAIKHLSEVKPSSSSSVASTSSSLHNDESDTESLSAMSSSTQNSSSSSSLKRSFRGRSLLSAGRVRGRRSTPTPRMRDLNIFGSGKGSTGSKSSTSSVSSVSSTNSEGSNAAEDGFSIVTTPSGDLASMVSSNGIAQNTDGFMMQYNNLAETLNYTKPVQAKDELVDVIQNLRNEKNLQMSKAAVVGSTDPSELKSNWSPKANIPARVPKLPVEYIHRHRLMKHVVNSLLDRPGMGTREPAKDCTSTFITSVTSRHADKAGNGKTFLAIAAIQTVEVREKFCDGIIWIKLGRDPLTEMDVRYLYQDIYRQINTKGNSIIVNDEDDDDIKQIQDYNQEEKSVDASSITTEQETQTLKTTSMTLPHFLPKSRRKFQGGELEGMKEDLANYICSKRILLCIDDVWSADDLDWFLFQKMELKQEESFRIMMTTRQPGLLSGPSVHEVFVRIFSEHEAIKLLLSSAGRHPHGSKTSRLFNDARIIVKGCGNSPMAIRLVGGMLRREPNSFTLYSNIWKALLEKCRFSLEEATKLRSFSKAIQLIMDLTFTTIVDVDLRKTLRRCFVTFAMAFRHIDWIKIGRGIPRSVLLDLFGVIQNSEVLAAKRYEEKDRNIASPIVLLKMMETMHLLERVNKNEDCKEKEETISYIIHDSIKSIGEEMASRQTSSFSPPNENCGMLDDDRSTSSSWSSALRNTAAKYLYSNPNKSDESGVAMLDYQFQEIMVAALTGSWGLKKDSAPKTITSIFSKRHGRVITCPAMEEYIVTFLPIHLIRAKALLSAGELLVDKVFISRRVKILGSVLATRRHVMDLVELRRELLRDNGDRNASSDENLLSLNPSFGLGKDEDLASSAKKREENSSKADGKDTNIHNILRDGSRRMIDEVYRVDTGSDKRRSSQQINNSSSSNSNLSLNLAICLSLIGEGLLRCRLPRDAMLRLEEAVGIYRGLLGPYHIDVARALFCAARAYVRIGEHRVALLKFGEANQIFETCNSLKHCDALANAQNMASLLFELGDFTNAEAKYQELIALRQALPNGITYELARTLNDYAAVLAKHGKVDEALARYEESRSVFQRVAGTSLSPNEVLFIDSCYDIVMLDLNIASIKAKKGDLPGAISAYENVVRVLRKPDAENAPIPANRDPSLFKHLLVAMGRIGSLKLKQGDNNGALQAYQEVLNELTETSPTFVQIEVARSHIKCAMIFRQESSTKKAIDHLNSALKMYISLYGPTHRDTQALQASLRKWQQEWQQTRNG